MASASSSYVQETVEQMIVLLEQGVEPWEPGWDASRAMPYNAHTGKMYRGANIIRLAMRGRAQGFGEGGWLTFKQALEHGGAVKKGEKGCPILIYQPGRAASAEEEQGEPGRPRGFARSAYVFHISQCDGLDALAPAPAPMEGLADQLVQAHGVRVVQGPAPCYLPLLDLIEMPAASSFHAPERREATLLHELMHWTGHVTRQHRKFGASFGDEAYAMEELVAELGAASLCRQAGLPGLTMQTAYLDFWIKQLRGEPQLLWQVMRMAEVATSFLLAPLEQSDAELDEEAA
jgi:antirestriction protein ArdC